MTDRKPAEPLACFHCFVIDEINRRVDAEAACGNRIVMDLVRVMAQCLAMVSEDTCARWLGEFTEELPRLIERERAERAARGLAPAPGRLH